MYHVSLCIVEVCTYCSQLKIASTINICQKYTEKLNHIESGDACYNCCMHACACINQRSTLLYCWEHDIVSRNNSVGDAICSLYVEMSLRRNKYITFLQIIEIPDDLYR